MSENVMNPHNVLLQIVQTNFRGIFLESHPLEQWYFPIKNHLKINQ